MRTVASGRKAQIFMNFPLAPADLYHVGLIVPDVEATARQLTEVAGYSWTKPIEYTLAVRFHDRAEDVPLRFVYSIEEPNLELVQQVSGTPWTAPVGSAAHHLGYFVDDIPETVAQLESEGFALEACLAGDPISTFAYLVSDTGLRVEIVDRNLFPDWNSFLTMMAAEYP
ncbi:VOC family protein [Nocardia sp. NPDC057455]|uniref:VOC family protein n=1 Tax=Nocardia sp. NPDC057455 TaxID=3346138 RepID=UPI00366B9BE2